MRSGLRQVCCYRNILFPLLVFFSLRSVIITAMIMVLIIFRSGVLQGNLDQWSSPQQCRVILFIKIADRGNLDDHLEKKANRVTETQQGEVSLLDAIRHPSPSSTSSRRSPSLIWWHNNHQRSSLSSSRSSAQPLSKSLPAVCHGVGKSDPGPPEKSFWHKSWENPLLWSFRVNLHLLGSEKVE